jgi:hypothetical protein
MKNPLRLHQAKFAPAERVVADQVVNARSASAALQHVK